VSPRASAGALGERGRGRIPTSDSPANWSTGQRANRVVIGYSFRLIAKLARQATHWARVTP
jgi:hypothetical protein